MAQKKNNRLDALRSQAPLHQGEEYVGAFFAMSNPNWGWRLLIGPLVSLAMKQYQVMVTNQRVYFGRFSVIGKLAGIDKFNLDEIKSVSFKKGPLTYNIAFKFKNGRSLSLRSNHKGLGSMDGFLFDPKTAEYLTKAIA